MNDKHGRPTPRFTRRDVFKASAGAAAVIGAAGLPVLVTGTPALADNGHGVDTATVAAAYASSR